MILKKIILAITLLLTSAVLIACGSKVQEADYQAFTPSASDIRVHLTYQGDKLLTQTTETTLLYEAFGIQDAQDAEEQFASGLADWDGIEGIDHEVIYEDDRLIEKTKIDYETVDLEKNADLLQTEASSDSSANYISYKLTSESFEDQGLTKVEDGKFKNLD